MAQPEPGQFDRLVARPPVTGLADALLAIDAAALPGTGRQSAIAGDLAPVAEVLVEQLVHQRRGEGRAERLEPLQARSPLRHRSRNGTGLCSLCLFQRRNLLAYHGQARVLALHFGQQVRRYRLALPIPLLREKIKAIGDADLWSGRIPDMINAYFVDLDRVVEQCANRLKIGAMAGFVVADSAYSGIVVPVDLILSEILERRGFTTQKICLFRQTRGNGNHQQRSSERLKEVMVVAEYRGGVKNQSISKSA